MKKTGDKATAELFGQAKTGFCIDCKHREVLEYRSGKRFSYCKLQPSKLTGNGLLKVKPTKDGCQRHERGEYTGYYVH